MGLNIGDLVTNPLVEAGANWLGWQDYNRAYQEAKKANLWGYNQGRGNISDLRKRVENRAAVGEADEAAIADRLRGEVATDVNDLQQGVNTGYDQRARLGQRYAEDFGDDINAAYENRESRDLGALDEDITGQQIGYGSRTQNVLGGLRPELDAVTQGYGDLRTRGLGYLDSVSDQQRQDIEQQFTESEAEQLADLSSRGLSGTTIGSNVRSGIARDQSAEVRRLEDDLAQQRLAYDTEITGAELTSRGNAARDLATAEAGLSGEALSSSERLALARAEYAGALGSETLGARERVGALGYDALTGLSGDALAAEERLGTWGTGQNAAANELVLGQERRSNDQAIGYDIGLTDMENDWIQAREDPYPQSNFYIDQANRFGAARANQPPPEPKWYESWGGPAIGAVGTIGGAALGGPAGAAVGGSAGGFFGGQKSYKYSYHNCIDGLATLICPTGTRRLRDIRVGHEVLTPNGFKKVTKLDYGTPPLERAHDFIQIITDSGRINCTVDHYVGGKAAGLWKVGETIPMGGEFYENLFVSTAKVGAIHKINSLDCGDIEVDGGRYFANGFVVHSMFGAILGTPVVYVDSLEEKISPGELVAASPGRRVVRRSIRHKEAVS